MKKLEYPYNLMEKILNSRLSPVDISKIRITPELTRLFTELCDDYILKCMPTIKREIITLKFKENISYNKISKMYKISVTGATYHIESLRYVIRNHPYFEFAKYIVELLNDQYDLNDYYDIINNQLHELIHDIDENFDDLSDILDSQLRTRTFNEKLANIVYEHACEVETNIVISNRTLCYLTWDERKKQIFDIMYNPDNYGGDEDLYK